MKDGYLKSGENEMLKEGEGGRECRILESLRRLHEERRGSWEGGRYSRKIRQTEGEIYG